VVSPSKTTVRIPRERFTVAAQTHLIWDYLKAAGKNRSKLMVRLSLSEYVSAI